jgi:sulfate adenylyltransferase
LAASIPQPSIPNAKNFDPVAENVLGELSSFGGTVLLTQHTALVSDELVDLFAGPERAAGLREASSRWVSWDLSPRQLCDLELLINGGFSPLQGFLTRDDYESVCVSMRLQDGALWPIPITLDVSTEFAEKIGHGDSIALRDPEGFMLAALHVEEVWQPDLRLEAELVYGTSNPEHPGVAHLLNHTQPYYVGGRVEGLRLPVHYDFPELRQTPAQLREEFARAGWDRVVAFQTRNPLHRAHFELTRQAMEETGAKLLIHPVVGMTKPGDVDHYTRIRCYQSLMPHYQENTAQLALLPLAMRMAGPREALWHALIRKNYGCTAFIVGRDHAGPGRDSSGKPFYGPYEAQEMVSVHEAEMKIEVVPFKAMVYVEEIDSYLPEDNVFPGCATRDISGTELRRRLNEGDEIPEWFTFPEVARELRATYPPRSQQGFTVFFTGLSASGKSSTANALLVMLLEMGGRPVTLLDGDLVRRQLSSELGFSKEHRDLNIRRVGYVSSEITKNGGIAICAAIAPYDYVRQEVRATVETRGGFILVHMATPLDVCEIRDRKGLYAKARAGTIREFTGISDPYELPGQAEVVIDNTLLSPKEAAQQIIQYLIEQGFLADSVTLETACQQQ